MSSTQWDKMGSIYKDTYPQNTPNSINNRPPFLLSKDAAKNVPANPGDWNDTAEELRVQGLDAIGTALKYTGIPQAFGFLDRQTNGGFSKLLMAGFKNVRSNYAFTRDVADKNAALGILSGLFTVTGAAVGGIAGFTVGGPVGAAAGASIGAATIGKLQREVAQTDYVKNTANFLYNASKFSESDAGQEEYNFGRDVTRFTSAVTGWKTLGDTSKGIGSITSGLINFGFEMSASPDIGLLKGAGAVGRRALVAPIDEIGTGLVSKRLTAADSVKAAERLQQDIDLIKRTANGEVTKYTPIFDFYKKNSPAVVAQRAEFRGDIPSLAAHLVAGADDATISLILRIGRFDKEAIKELDTLSASKLAEYTRVDDAIKIAEQGGQAYVAYKGQLITASNLAPNSLNYLKKEVESLSKEVQWFKDAELISGSMTERTASKWGWVERVRNDLAKERAARKFELSKPSVFSSSRVTDNLARETKTGSVIQTFYQRSPFSVAIRAFDRTIDDAPRQTINFNDRLLAADRLRANIRNATTVGALSADDGIKLYNEFLSASDEATKLNIVNSYTAKISENLGKKYGISELLIKDILQEYDRLHRTVLDEARLAKSENRAYMISPNGDLVKDPQLISQLANGAYIADAKVWDKAFKSYKKKYGSEAGLPIKTGIASKFIADEFLSLWRGFTLLRAGFPLNIIRDSAIRMLGDGVLFPVLKILSTDALHSITNTSNTAAKVKSALGGVNPKNNLANIRSNIASRDTAILSLEKQLTAAKVDFNLPIAQIPADYVRHVTNLNNMKATVAQLRNQERAIMAKTPPVKRVSRDTIVVHGYDFPAANAGKFGDISMQQLRMQDDLRRALSSMRELETSNLRRSRTGSRSITPKENEQLHLASWANILKDQIGNDAVAKIIMSGGTKKDVSKFLRTTSEGQDYLSRMGLRPSDTSLVYRRVGEVLKQFAPTKNIQALILGDKVTVDALRRLYPNVNQRPVVLTDMVDDMLGKSNPYRAGKEMLDNSIAWLATAPTTKLMYAPYFAFKYQHKLQKLVHLAEVQGMKLTLKDKEHFERLARSYAINEYRTKLNSFHRDMNYTGLVNYAIAFFPAIVEQYRAYGKITLEHPDFLLKAVQIKAFPDRVFQTEQDPFGQKYYEVDLPILGLKGRLPTEWFNPFNPTGNTLIGAGPVVSASWNEYVKRAGGESALEKKVTDWALPFGVQANSAQALLPNTVKRFAQAVVATTSSVTGNKPGGGSQFNRDVNMFMRQFMADYADQYHKNPTALELNDMKNKAEDRALFMSTLRLWSAFLLPSQPRYVTAIQPFADELTKMRQADPLNGEEDFINLHPELFFLADSLSNSLSGLRSDDTAVNLLKNNIDTAGKLVAVVGKNNLSLLGAVFNDDNYAFSSKAQAWLESNNIPGTSSKFREFGEPLEAARSSYIGKGWQDWNKFIDAVKLEVSASSEGGYNANRGYGAVLVDYYKTQYLDQQKTQNPLWYDAYMGGRGAAGVDRQHRLVDALTIAINDDKMWKDMSQNPRWYAVTQYLNFRYSVYESLQQMGTTIDSKKATFIRENVNEFVDNLKKQSPDFGVFYERYFSSDNFDHVYGG